QLQMMINQKRAKALKEQNLAAVTPEILSPPTEETCLTKTIAEIDLMNKIIEQMVQITKIDSGKMVVNLVECDLVPLARDMASTLALNLGEERLKLEVIDPEVRAKVDPSALQQILSNLISNAAKYSPETAPVIIRVYAKENRACIAVEDKGIGIPLADQKSVFSKFYRSSNLAGVATEGLGLGLYITARLVELQGGEINLTSTPGKGSTFEVQFPNL
ncbi:MAG: HAMP domain-containing histidine kinase, partial [Firmicutes bacterium]|nr:HAMP domain-containing histidine kinase [Bacillota bacterium]